MSILYLNSFLPFPCQYAVLKERFVLAYTDGKQELTTIEPNIDRSLSLKISKFNG